MQTAAERTRTLITRRRQPLPVGLHLFAGVDRGQGRRDPPRFKRVGRVRAVADLTKTKVLAGLNNRGAYLFAFGVRPPNLEARRAGHAVAQRANLTSRDVDDVHAEKLDVRKRPTVELFDHLLRVRPLNLVAVKVAHDGLPGWDRGRSVVLSRRHVISAGLGMELNPARRRRAPDVTELVLFQMKENSVANHIAVVGARSELFRLVDGKFCKAIGGQVGEQLEGIGA